MLALVLFRQINLWTLILLFKLNSPYFGSIDVWGYILVCMHWIFQKLFPTSYNTQISVKQLKPCTVTTFVFNKYLEVFSGKIWHIQNKIYPETSFAPNKDAFYFFFFIGVNGFLLLIQLSWRVTFPCQKIRNHRDITNLTTGWSKKTVLCYMSLMDWKTPNGTYHVFYSIVYIGRFNYLPLFYFGPNFCPLKNIGKFLGN